MTGGSRVPGLHSPSVEADELQGRLRQLSDIGELADGRIPADLQARIHTVATTAEARLGHGTSHTVVALAGATGSGKSSLFNALVPPKKSVPAMNERPIDQRTPRGAFFCGFFVSSPSVPAVSKP